MNSVFEFAWLAPRNLLILGVLGWRRWISPLYGDVCRYHPTCSAYGLGQLQQRGVIAGSVLTIWRILRCNPWSRGGVDVVKPGSGRFRVSEAGFVLPNKKG
ncbi:MAG: membrane protein insertion efficiency factor YidD [Micrococcales bacterium]